MKRFLIPLLLLFVACSSHELSEGLMTSYDFDKQTKGLSSVGNNCFVVNENDLNNFVKFRTLEGKSKNKNVVLEDIQPIEYNGITSLYVIKYQEGFEVISADKRSPVPLASNSKAQYSEVEDYTGFSGHLSLLAEEVWYSLHDLLGKPTPGAEENIQASLDFWKMVNADRSFIESHSNDKSLSKQGEGGLDGGWFLFDVETVEEVYDSIPHLTSTTWHQFNPYNYYCPYDLNQNNSLVKCPAGCVAVAGAQMLYYLHSKDGIPVNSPSTGYCQGYVYDNSYVQYFGDPSPTTWDNMIIPRSNYFDFWAALLVGDVGQRLDMEYHYDGSGAYVSDLVDVFNAYGWDCLYYGVYDSYPVVSSLLSGYPVVCGGSRNEQSKGKIGHSFLIDSYKRYRTKTITTYEWVDFEPLGPGIHQVQLMQTTEYGSPHVSYYRMNWGQVSTVANDTWCSLDGVWQYESLPPYIYDQEMICYFTPQS